jgi:hypothetical protein
MQLLQPPPISSLLTFRQGGARKPCVGDGAALNGMRFVWHTGIPSEDLPPSLGRGMACWRRLLEGNASHVW